jgi:protein-disulfide isomerase
VSLFFRYNATVMSLLLALILAAPVSAEQAKQIVPRADLAGLTDDQRGVFLEVATDIFDYAGCQDTLAKCLASGVKDPHALRMAELVKQFAHDGFPAVTIVQVVERYYASFEPRQRLKIRSDNCAVLGKGPVTIVEFSDYQCPHCAAAVQPLHQLVTETRKGKVRLCSKHYPFPQHPRARIAASCAEYARSKGKFWQMHEQIFAHQEQLEDANLKDYAKQAGLDGEEMLKQVYAGKFDDAVEKHIREGTAAGVESTPALYIDGRIGILPAKPWFLQFTVDDELQWQKEKGWKFDGGKQVARGK